MGTPKKLTADLATASTWLRLFDRYSAGVFWWDPDLDKVYWSDRIFETLGYERGDGASYDDIDALRDPAEVIEVREAVFASRDNKTDLEMVNRLRHVDGTYRQFRVCGIWAEKPAGGKFLLGYLTEITELVEAVEHAENVNALFKSFFDQAPCGVFIKDKRLRHIYGNEQAAKLAGCTLEDFLALNHNELFDEAAAAALWEADRQVLEEGKVLEWTGWLDTASGEKRFVMDKKFPITNPITKETVIAGFGIDITKQKRSEDELDQLRRLESLGELVTGIAHDFNNTLAVIQGSLELLSSETDQEERKELGEAAIDAVRRGARLTQDLLSFGRRSTLQIAAADMNAVVSDMVRLFRRTIPETIDILSVPASRLWPALIDRSRVEDALLNLAINSRDAMPNGGTLKIETSNVKVGGSEGDYSDEEVKSGRYVLLTISDTGCGMDPLTAQRAFDPFFTTKPVGAGTGMGLSMVFGLMKQLGGVVRIYSELGIGTTVKLFFPASPELRIGKQNRSDCDGLSGGSERILIVEDEDGVRELLDRQLTALGYSVVQASDGDKGLEILKDDTSIDLIVSDVVMPGSLLGTQLAHRARAIRPNLPFVFVSGYPADASTNGAGLSPGDRFLMKPVPLRTLARSIREVLDSPDSKN